MKQLKNVVASPSAFDSMANYTGEIPEDNWLCLLTRNRDSDTLTESNFECALKELGGESETVRIDRFGHWACGWWESLSVLKDSRAEEMALSIEKRLESYPVLNDDDWSKRQYETHVSWCDDETHENCEMDE